MRPPLGEQTVKRLLLVAVLVVPAFADLPWPTCGPCEPPHKACEEDPVDPCAIGPRKAPRPVPAPVPRPAPVPKK